MFSSGELNATGWNSCSCSRRVCGVGAVAQLSSGGYGVRDAPLQIKGLKPWYGCSICAWSGPCLWGALGVCSKTPAASGLLDV